ncbi:hypothetical protein R84981_001412 [Carnimonas sp. R-84981]|uniref:hypothetical protein n=1 Tax=Carnimonas bestiolae TaxID=3402172 RepID=UPI003EDCA0F2
MIDLEDTTFGFIGSIYYKSYIFDKSRPVVLTFNGLGNTPNSKNARKGISPWGFEYIKKRKYNVISFTNVSEHFCYYRDDTFLSKLEEFGEALKIFPERIGYGQSMGGYAASAFSGPLNIDRLLLLSPISTREEKLAFWDKEAKRGLFSFKYDWSGLYSDGAETKARGAIIYDPLYRLDKLHADRYTTLEKLPLPGVGHLVSENMLRMGILDWAVTSFLEGGIDKEKFLQKSRKRRELRQYYQWLVSEENIHATEKRNKIIEKFFKAKFGNRILDFGDIWISEHENNSDTTVITFECAGEKLSSSCLETKTLLEKGYNNLHVSFNTKYLESNNLSIKDFKRSIDSKIKNRKAICFGTHFGGYLALYFGGIINAKVISITPLLPNSLYSKNDQALIYNPLKKVRKPKTPPTVILDPYDGNSLKTLNDYIFPLYANLESIGASFYGNNILEDLRVSKKYRDKLYYLMEEQFSRVFSDVESKKKETEILNSLANCNGNSISGSWAVGQLY